MVKIPAIVPVSHLRQNAARVLKDAKILTGRSSSPNEAVQRLC